MLRLAITSSGGVLDGWSVSYSYDSAGRRTNLTLLHNGVILYQVNYHYNTNSGRLYQVVQDQPLPNTSTSQTPIW